MILQSRGFSNWRKIRNPVDKSAVIGFTISGVALALSILFEPRFMQWHGIVVISTIIGINEAIIHLNENEIRTAPQNSNHTEC